MIAATAEELRAIALAATDASGYFPAMYARVTRRIGSSAVEGAFANAAGMDAFATRFAAYYVEAGGNERGRPRCWQACWNVAGDDRLLIVQHLLLGINAHVNHDLALAVVDIADELGDLDQIRPDFEAVSDILAATYQDILKDLDRVSRWVNSAARLGGGRGFNFSLRVARAQAWSAAERMYALDDVARRRYRADLDQLVSVLAYLVTRPPLAVRPLLAIARRLEEKNVGRVVNALLGEAESAHR